MPGIDPRSVGASVQLREAFTINSATVFKEDVDIVPTIIDDTLSYVPWGGDNLLPFNIIDLLEKDVIGQRPLSELA